MTTPLPYTPDDIEVITVEVPGISGPAGPPGPPGTITSASATALAAGSTPTVTLGGTPSARTLTLGIPTGATGATGPANTLIIGTVNTLAAGATATATITGTAPNQTLNLGIPQGAAGAGSPDATTTAKGSVQLAGDLAGTAALPRVRSRIHRVATQDAGASNAGKWFPIGTIVLPTRYADVTATYTWGLGNHGTGDLQGGRLGIRIKQQNALGEVPFQSLLIWDSTSLIMTPADFQLIIEENSVTQTVASLWVRNPQSWSSIRFFEDSLIMNSNATLTYRDSEAPVDVASLPAGTKVPGTYTPSETNLATANTRVRRDVGGGAEFSAVGLNGQPNPWNATRKDYVDKVGKLQAINVQTGTAYTFVMDDMYREVNADNPAAITYTIPENATVPFPIGTVLTVQQRNTGGVSIVAAGAAAVNAPPGFANKTAGVAATIYIRKRDTDRWITSGHLEPLTPTAWSHLARKDYVDNLAGLNASFKAADHTLVLADANSHLVANSASLITFTVPTNASVAFPIGTRIRITRWGTGSLALATAAGVSVAGVVAWRAQFRTLEIIKVATDSWVAVDVEPSATTGVVGVVQLATTAEATTGTDTTKAVTPAGLKTVADTKANASHTHVVADISATGTRDATTYLRGDGTWATPAGGTGGTVTAANITDASAIGRTVITSATAADIRNAISAGTSNLTIGTTSTTAKAGDYTPPAATTTTTGLIQLAGDLGGTATAPTVRAATTSVAGIIELASVTETNTGTEQFRAVTPASLKPLIDTKVTGTGITAITTITQAAYDALATKVATTLYVIQG